MNSIIDNAIEYARKFFENDFTGHDFWHTLRVYNLAKSIAKTEECDVELICLSALLHDVDDRKLVGDNAEPFYNAKIFLRNRDYPEERIEKICHIISQVSFKGSDSVKPDSIEGMIVQDADRLDSMGAMGIGRTFAYGGSHNRPMHVPTEKPKENMSQEEYYAHLSTSINHLYEKILLLKDLMNTQTARKMAEHRHEFVERFLKEFLDEWEGIL